MATRQQTAQPNARGHPFVTMRTEVLLVPRQRRVRAVFGGQLCVDSHQAVLVYEPGHQVPRCFFPLTDVRTDMFESSAHDIRSDALGHATVWHLRYRGTLVEDAAWCFRDPPAYCHDLASYVTLRWDAMDAWFEEDERVHTHPKDPYHRIDALRSSRHVRVRVADEIVAETRRPVLLFETLLPVRCYMPLLDVRMDLLEPSHTVTHCAYKGEASYWHVHAGGRRWDDLAWTYRHPSHEYPQIAGLAAFFNERVDLEIDGERQERPVTQWSRDDA